MSLATLPSRPGTSRATGLFLRRWLRNPLQMGSVVPSSRALCARLADMATWDAGQAVVELGAGTGVVSRALLAAGLPAHRLFVIEIVPEMAAHLARSLPGAQVITGDAMELPALIPPVWHGRIGTIICGIPMVLMPLDRQRRLIGAIDAVAPGRGFLHFSYCITSPLPAHRLGLSADRRAWVPGNFPPASVWSYRPA